MPGRHSLLLARRGAMMSVFIWAITGIVSSVCCARLAGFRIGRGIRQYIEFSIVGCIGGILGAFLVKDVLLLFSFIYATFYRTFDLLFDGVFAGLLFCCVLSTLFIKYLRPSSYKSLGVSSFLVVLFLCLFLCFAVLFSFFVRYPTQDAFLVAEQLKLTNLDADAFLVNVLAPLVGAWGCMLTIIVAFLLHFSDVTIKSAPTSLLVGLPSVIRSHMHSKRIHTYLIYDEHKNAITSIAWSSDGKHIISTSSDQACIWEASTGNTIFTHSLVALSHNVAWKPSGIHIVSSSQNVRTQKINNTAFSVSTTEYTIPLNSINTPIWSPNYKYMAVVSMGTDDTIQICDASNGQVMQTYRDHTAPVLAVAWSPNGEYIASGGKDKTVRVWNAIMGTHIYTYQGHEDAVRTIAWSVDSKRLATGSLDHTIHIWQATTGDDVFIYRGHTAPVLTVAWSPDGKQVASGSHDRTARAWNASTGKEICFHNGHRDDVLTVQWSPNGRSVASGSADMTIHVWDVAKSNTGSKSSELQTS